MSYKPMKIEEINEEINAVTKALSNFIEHVVQDACNHNTTAEEVRALPAVAEVFFRSLKHYD